MCRQRERSGFTLIEMIVVIAIIAVLVALLVPAAQKARNAANRTMCTNNLRQITLGLHQYHDANRSFPPGVKIGPNAGPYPYLSWRVRVFPYLEQDAAWKQTQTEYSTSPFPFLPPHSGFSRVQSVFSCPADPRVWEPQRYQKRLVALSSYLGVEGLDYKSVDGLLFLHSAIRMAEVTDGLSNTLAVGERPPSNNFRFGWLYAGNGQASTGSCDHTLGAMEIGAPISACPPGPYSMKPSQLGVPCSFLHFWSLHAGGCNFAFADGSVHFLSYGAANILPSLASRSGGEVVQPF